MTSIRLLLPLNITSAPSAECPSFKCLSSSGVPFTWNGPYSIGSSEFLKSWSAASLQYSSRLSRPLAWTCQYKGGAKHSFRGRKGGEEELPIVLGLEEQIPNQAESVVEGAGSVLVSEYKPIPDLDYLQELLAIQQQGPRAIGFFGTRNMGYMHQQLIEILSYAMVITKNHIYTSGASGTNAAVIRGALRAEKPDLLTVILPQSLKMQSPESQELLSKVQFPSFMNSLHDVRMFPLGQVRLKPLIANNTTMEKLYSSPDVRQQYCFCVSLVLGHVRITPFRIDDTCLSRLLTFQFPETNATGPFQHSDARAVFVP
eukprot:Gb_24848 [translate_table: standard]